MNLHYIMIWWSVLWFDDQYENLLIFFINIILLTKSIPEIFLTVQKSIDRRMTMSMKFVMKLVLNHPHKIKSRTARARNATWQNTATGCLQVNQSIGVSYIQSLYQENKD